jgi:uridine kinase
VEFPVFAALVDHKLKELSYDLFYNHEVTFIGYNHPDGRRTYFRSLGFVLQRAVRDLWPDKVLIIDHCLPSGFFCEIVEAEPDDRGKRIPYLLNAAEVSLIQARMQELVEADLPITKVKMLAEDACKIFDANNQPLKAGLIRSLGRYFCSVYYLDGLADSFHGPLVPSTGYLKVFRLFPFSNGFCLQYPEAEDPSRLIPIKPQVKLSETFKKYSEWCFINGALGVGSLNRRLLDGDAVNLINICEARHERKYVEIADRIFAEKDRIKIVFIAGPSSSGKTSSSLRIAQQCRVLGLTPKVIELDNYFLPRELTPRDEKGELDFEVLEALDIELLNRVLTALLGGETVEPPKFDFVTGRPAPSGKPMQLEQNDILLMEGIHALNPALTPTVDQAKIFRIYISALSSLPGGEKVHNSTTDKRLLRRIVRDNRTRGISPEDTLLRWPSVRRGEERNIFPYEENADVVFNSSTLYDVPVLKYYAEPLLEGIAESSPAYEKARALVTFLSQVVAIRPAEIAAIPPTSIMREFIGGQTL